MKLGTVRDRQDEPVAARQSTQKRRKWRSGKQAHIPHTLQSTLSITSKYVSHLPSCFLVYEIYTVANQSSLGGQVRGAYDGILERRFLACCRL